MKIDNLGTFGGSIFTLYFCEKNIVLENSKTRKDDKYMIKTTRRNLGRYKKIIIFILILLFSLLVACTNESISKEVE